MIGLSPSHRPPRPTPPGRNIPRRRRTTRPLSQPRAGRGALWGALGFIVGCILTTVVALALLAPSPLPSASGPATGSALTVTLTDTLLTQSLSSNMGAGAVAIVQPQAHIRANGQIVVTGTLQGSSPLAGSAVTVVTQPYVSQNTLAIRVLRASVDDFALPTAVFDGLLDQVNRQLVQSSRISFGVGQALVVTGVSFAEGKMTLSYTPTSA